MDYNLKKENRKKFQDKSKLKRHHKKNYAKVVRTDGEGQVEAEEPERVRKHDEEGHPILFSDEEFDLEGNIVLKGTTNDFRYKDILVDEELDLKQYDVDFKKELNREFIVEKQKKTIQDYKTRDLIGLSIVDQEFDVNNQADKRKPIPETYQYDPPVAKGTAVNSEKPETKLPQALRGDEDFLDDLL